MTDQRFAAFEAHPDGDSVRFEEHMGRPHLVAPAVLVREGVLNGGFLSADEIAKSAPAWNGVPATAPPSLDDSGHPVDEEGNFASAAQSPETFEQYHVGRIFNAEFDPEIAGLTGEIWVNIDRTKEVGPAATEAARRLADGDQLEVSTGYWHGWTEQAGTYNGTDYEQEQFDILPDHLATLPNEEGACSWADGCGAPRVQQYLPATEDADGATGSPSPRGDGDTADPEGGLSAAKQLLHLSHRLTGQECDCTGGESGADTTTDQTMTDTDSDPDGDHDYDVDALAEQSAFDADTLREDADLAEKVAETVAAAPDGGGGSTGDGSTETETTESGNATPDADGDDDSPADADGDDGDSETIAIERDELDELVANRVEEKLTEREQRTRADELKDEIVANSDKERDDLPDAVDSLEIIAEMARGGAADDAPGPKVGANYAGRGAPQSRTGDDGHDDYDLDTVGVLASQTREEREANGAGGDD